MWRNDWEQEARDYAAEVAAMNVRRVTTGKGSSHIEPPCEGDWPYVKKLMWHAAVISADTGITVTIAPAHLTIDGRRIRDVFNYRVGRSSGGAYSAREMWTWLNGFFSGAQTRQ